jgi:hypothetical protein
LKLQQTYAFLENLAENGLLEEAARINSDGIYDFSNKIEIREY